MIRNTRSRLATALLAGAASLALLTGPASAQNTGPEMGAVAPPGDHPVIIFFTYSELEDYARTQFARGYQRGLQAGFEEAQMRQSGMSGQDASQAGRRQTTEGDQAEYQRGVEQGRAAEQRLSGMSEEFRRGFEEGQASERAGQQRQAEAGTAEQRYQDWQESQRQRIGEEFQAFQSEQAGRRGEGFREQEGYREDLSAFLQEQERELNREFQQFRQDEQQRQAADAEAVQGDLADQPDEPRSPDTPVQTGEAAPEGEESDQQATGDEMGRGQMAERPDESGDPQAGPAAAKPGTSGDKAATESGGHGDGGSGAETPQP